MKSSLSPLIIIFGLVFLLILCACSSNNRVDGWYPVSDYPDNLIVGKPLVTVNDFDNIALSRDSFVAEGDTVSLVLIQGRVKAEKQQQWADDTERMIGKRIGFVYNDSVVTAPQINARIESGSFQIISSDTILIKNIYNSILQQIKLQ